MKLFLYSIVILLLPGLCMAKIFKGSVTIEEVDSSYSPELDPDFDQLSICTDDTKYRTGPNSTLNFLLYIKNPMKNRSYEDLRIEIPSEFNVSLSEIYIESLAPQEVHIVNVTVDIPEGVEGGKYPTGIKVTTKDYPAGFSRAKLIHVSNKWRYVNLGMLILSLVVLVVFGFRFFWIRHVNASKSRGHKPKT